MVCVTVKEEEREKRRGLHKSTSVEESGLIRACPGIETFSGDTYRAVSMSSSIITFTSNRCYVYGVEIQKSAGGLHNFSFHFLGMRLRSPLSPWAYSAFDYSRTIPAQHYLHKLEMD